MDDQRSLKNRALVAWNQWRNLNHNRQIFAAAMSVGLLSLLAKPVYIVRDMVVAYEFGRGDTFDAYVIAYALPAFLVSTFTSVFGSAFVPVFLRVWGQQGRLRAQTLLSGAVFGNLVILGFCCLTLWGSGSGVAQILGSGFAPVKLALTYHLFMLLVPVVLLGGLIAVTTALLNANEKFSVPVLSSLFTSGISTFTLFIFSDKWGIYALVIGILIGQLVELLYLYRRTVQLDWQLQPSWSWGQEDRQLLTNQMVSLTGGVLLMGSLDLIDSSMASMLAAGSVSALSYGTRISLAVIGLGGAALGTVVLPRFSRLLASGEWREVRKILRTYNRLIMVASLPIIAAMAIFSKELIGIIYQRGAFVVEDTNLVSQVLIMHVLQMPFYLMGMLNVRVINAAHKNHWLMLITAGCVIANIVGNYVLMNIFGAAGIALATTIVFFLSWLVLRVLVYRLIDRSIAEFQR